MLANAHQLSTTHEVCYDHGENIFSWQIETTGTHSSPGYFLLDTSFFNRAPTFISINHVSYQPDISQSRAVHVLSTMVYYHRYIRLYSFWPSKDCSDGIKLLNRMCCRYRCTNQARTPSGTHSPARAFSLYCKTCHLPSRCSTQPGARTPEPYSRCFSRYSSGEAEHRRQRDEL